MREVTPAFNNLQDRILESLECEWGAGYDEGKDMDETDGHLLKLIERGYVQKLDSGKFMLTYDINGNPLYKCNYYTE